MENFVSILRGINLGNHNKISMPELKALYEKLGFNKVQTYIQSGNVIFETEETPTLAQTIEQGITSQFGFEIPVIIRRKSALAQIIAGNPFLKDNSAFEDKMHVTLLANEPTPAVIEKIHDYPPDQYKIIGKEIYLYCPNGYGRTKLTNTFFEKKLKVIATTRNWRTINEIFNRMNA
ncbi:MAG: DUF1697 domain-containing protein [Siphonobacter sp.]